ncbi:MAG TPA: YfhO family protein [Thermoanaerobaculia bacterium]|nr:YfhO family protein [Thermoanaerobaculia bacterium]
MRRVLGERALWILIACIVIFFSPALLGSTFFFRDLYLLFYGKKVLFAEALRQGQIPLWDPLMHGGQPFLNEPANSPFYPFNVLFLVLPILTAFNLLLVLQFVICALSAYFLGRAIGRSTVAAFVTGVVYTFCGYVLSSANLLVLLQSTAWAPALLASVHLLMRERRKRWFVAAAVFGALHLVGGSAEMAAVSFALAVAWMLVVPAEVPLSRRLAYAGLVVGFAASLSLMQTLPAYEVIRNSSRSEKRDYFTFTQWSVAPQRLPELVIPRFFGRTDTLARNDYWGWRYELGYPYIISIYFGVSALLLTIGGLTSPLLPRSGRIILGGFIAGGLLFCMGGWLPFFHLFYEHVPLVGIFRFPVKALQFTLVPIALASGAGVDAWPGRRTILAAAAAATLLAILTIGFRGAIARALFDPLPPAASTELARSFIHATVAAGLFVAACASKRKTAIATVVLLDLTFAGAQVNPYAPRELFDRPPLAGKVRALIGDGQKLYRTGDPYVRKLNAPSNENVWLAWWDIQLLSRYTAATFGIPIVFNDDYDGLAPIRMAHMGTAVEKLPWQNRLNVLSAAGASAILTPDVIASPDVDRVETLRSASGAPLFLYRNRASSPLRFATGAVVMSDDFQAFQRLAQNFDPNVVILSEGAPSTSQPRNPATIKTLHRTMNEWTVDVTTSEAGYLVFAETWYPGWQMTIDGRRVPMLRADVSFSAAAVPAGHHIVSKRYRPPLVFAGLAASVFAALILAFWRVRQ